MRKILCVALISALVLIVGCSNSEDIPNDVTEIKVETEVKESHEVELVPEPIENNDTEKKMQRPIISVEIFNDDERIGDVFDKGGLSQAKNIVYDNLKTAFEIYMVINPIIPIFAEYRIEECIDPYGLFYVFIIQLNDKDIDIDDTSFESIWGALSVDEMSFEVIDGIKIVIADEEGFINRVVTMNKE